MRHLQKSHKCSNHPEFLLWNAEEEDLGVSDRKLLPTSVVLIEMETNENETEQYKAVIGKLVCSLIISLCHITRPKYFHSLGVDSTLSGQLYACMNKCLKITIVHLRHQRLGVGCFRFTYKVFP